MLGCGLEGGVDLLVVVAAARQRAELVVAHVLDELAESGVGSEEVLADVGTGLGRQPLVLTVDRRVELVDEHIVGVGGEQLTFKAMMHGYAKVRGFKRLIVPVPVLAPKLAARWVGFVTPIPNRLAVPLIEGVVQSLLVKNDKAKELFPQIEPIGYERSVELALGKTELGDIETRWSGSSVSGEASCCRLPATT